MPSTTHSPSGKRYTPRFHITFALHDLPLAQYLSKLLGGVQIRIKTSEGACVLTVNSVNTLIVLVNLINGLLRTPKIEQFNSLVCWLRANSHGEFETHDLDTSDLTSNGWLAGFIDADGSFKIRVSSKKTDPVTNKTLSKGRVACSLTLEQRQVSLTGSFYLPILSAMCLAFNCNLNLSTHGTSQYFIFCLTSIAQLKSMVEYLDRYPLLSSKFLDYSDWRKAFMLIVDRQHLTSSGIEVISKLKSGMNRGRLILT